jgi:hypothetical protein
MKAAALALFVVGWIAFGIYMEVSMWNECRTDHSWFYCMRVLGK